MYKLWSSLLAGPFVLAATGLITQGAIATEIPQLELESTDTEIAQATPSVDELLNQVQEYGNEGKKPNQIDQVTNVEQFRDVSPGDWAYEALANLVNRYGCIVGYPDQTYRGNQALTRYEFAAGLNSCLNVIERLIVEGGGGIPPEDLERIQRLVSEFEAELATLGARVDDLEGRIAFLEDNQFSTTTKLEGEVVFGLADVFGGDELVDPLGNTIEGASIEDANETVFQNRVRLNFVTSFTGEDALYTRLDAGNAGLFTDGRVDENGEPIDLDQGALTYSFDNDNNVEIGWLAYYFSVGERLDVYLPAAFPLWVDFVPSVSPFFEGFTGANNAISSFAESSPIYKIGLASGGGIGLNYELTDAILLSGGYFGGDTFDPTEKNGLFDGEYSALGQVTWTPTDWFQVGLTYVNAYFPSEDSQIFDLGVGTFNGRLPFPNNAVSTNSYGGAFSIQPNDTFVVNGYFGYTEAQSETSEELDADIWYYALGVALPDFGKEGNLLGALVGVEPYVGGVDDNPLHVEGFYRFQVNDFISVTPGIIYLTAPGGEKDNDDVFIGVLRTTFTF